MTDINAPVQIIPSLHLRLSDARRDYERMRELACRLARALDEHVDARHGRRDPDVTQTGAALHDARRAGLL